MNRAAIVDAGPLYAYIDADDAHHQRCAELLAGYEGTLIVPQLVITEVCYLVQTRLGTRAELLFLGDLASGAFSVESVAAADWFRVIELVDTYRDFPLGTVDASVVVCAERLRIGDVVTLDRCHFRPMRPAHVPHFTLLP
ncbi:MAG TPA: PIN domain-containing protein [Pseudonocardiaceae bacterium]|nr:PIN domain-containing protein [Pseudonocardiaceae bacterium]